MLRSGEKEAPLRTVRNLIGRISLTSTDAYVRGLGCHGGANRKLSITYAQSNNLIEAWPGKPLRAWLRIVVDDFNHDMHVVLLTTLGQHRLRPFAVTEDTEAPEALVDGFERHRRVGVQ